MSPSQPLGRNARCVILEEADGAFRFPAPSIVFLKDYAERLTRISNSRSVFCLKPVVQRLGTRIGLEKRFLVYVNCPKIRFVFYLSFRETIRRDVSRRFVVRASHGSTRAKRAESAACAAAADSRNRAW
jgi:hypothetical protein